VQWSAVITTNLSVCELGRTGCGTGHSDLSDHHTDAITYFDGCMPSNPVIAKFEPAQTEVPHFSLCKRRAQINGIKWRHKK
jgi:hypothetical protein